MKDVSRREFLKTLCLGITVAALQNLPMTTAFADSAISKTKIISKSDRENLVATVARTVQVSYKIDKNTIIEVTRFTDIDGQNVTLNRSVKEDGTGELVYTKAQKTKKSKLTNQSYDVFLKLATSKSMPQTRADEKTKSAPRHFMPQRVFIFFYILCIYPLNCSVSLPVFEDRLLSGIRVTSQLSVS